MDENTIITKMIAGQLNALRDTAVEAFGDDSPLVAALDAAIEAATGGEGAKRTIPRRFIDEAQYDNFVMDQMDTLTGNLDDTPTEEAAEIRAGIYDNITDVVGAVPNPETGELEEVGSLDESVAKVDEAITEMENELGDEIEVGDYFIVAYTLMNGDNITEDDVDRIIQHPISNALRHMGHLNFAGVRRTDSPSTLEAVWRVELDGPISRKHFAVGAVAYAGQHVVPGVGLVQARGRVSWT